MLQEMSNAIIEEIEMNLIIKMIKFDQKLIRYKRKQRVTKSSLVLFYFNLSKELKKCVILPIADISSLSFIAGNDKEQNN